MYGKKMSMAEAYGKASKGKKKSSKKKSKAPSLKKMEREEMKSQRGY
jgi:hypothetical protein